jgi:hypothetical protein
MNKLRIIRNNKLIITMKFKFPDKRYNESKGDLDLMVDVGNGKNKYFDISCLSTPEGFRQCLAKINSISWHGFYYKDNKELKLPVIRFKENGIVKCHTRHTGIISMEEIYMFPICSFYIPQNISHYDFSKYLNHNNEFIVSLSDDNSARVDIFILPRFITFSDYMNNFSHSAIELVSDITLFDKSINCALYNLPIDSQDKMILNSFMINSYSIISRIIYTDTTREGNLIKYFSVLFHDPNNVIDRIMNRRYLFPKTSNDNPEFKLMRDRYNSERSEFIMPNETVEKV